MGEKETNLKAIASAARRILCNPHLEVFVPAISQDVRQDSHTMFYMEGYAFVQYAPGVSYSKLRETTYFKDVLRQPGSGGPTFAQLPDSKIQEMRAGMEKMKKADFEVGDQVRVIRGEFRNMYGVVTEVFPEKQHLMISNNLGSKPMLIEYPFSFIKKVSR